MDEAFFLLLLIFLGLGHGLGQEIDMNYTLKTNLQIIISALGESHKLQCYASGAKFYYISNPIVWTHEATDGRKTIISRDMAETNIYDRYHVVDKSADNIGSLELKITDVKSLDDGIFKCTIFSKQTNIVLDEISVKFVVIQPIQTMTFELKSDQFQKVTSLNDSSNETNSIYIPEGLYELTCAVNGSNPEPELRIVLDEMVLSSDTKIYQNNITDSYTRTYNGYNTYSIYLSSKQSGIILQCDSSLVGVTNSSSWNLHYNVTVLPNEASGTSVITGRLIIQHLIMIVIIYLVSS